MKTVLVADDNEGNREVLRVALETTGYRVVEAENGQQALEVARREGPELLILDIQMPLMDGYAVVTALRREERFAGTPAVAVTAYAMQGDEEKAIAAGFNRHIPKPINIRALRQLVADLMEGG